MTLLTRFIVAALAGLIVGAVACVLTGDWQYAPSTGWIAFAGVYVAGTWLRVGRMDAAATEAHATRLAEDSDSNLGIVEWMVVAASVFSLGGVGFLLEHASKSNVAAAVVGTLSVAASWIVVHTTFMLRYARLYYPDRGIDFKQDAAPTYADFAYLAFTVGMAYAVSDTDIKTREIRRTVLFQALVSFLLGAIILAVTINLIAGLLHLGS